MRAAVIQSLRDTHAPPADAIASTLGRSSSAVTAALHALADEHRLALIPGTDLVWMAHPFSAVPTNFVVTIGERQWYANCVWDGLSILALLGDGILATSSPATGEPIQFNVSERKVTGDALVHFLVPAKQFWTDIGFT
ncbi:MAG: hypothetical protein IPK16_18280 [Anaerolineales bacterium]|nr:hypothetical protein [Anaerolineales bacterium]